MTRKDFELIARTLKHSKPGEDGLDGDMATWSALVRAFARMCAAQNARFQFDTFYRACGLGA